MIPQNSSNVVKYFGIDIDKTFYIEDSSKFQKNIESFVKLKCVQVKPFFCTGRILTSSMNLMGDKFVRETGYRGFPGVYANGAIVYDHEGNIISHSFFTRSFLERFIKYIVDTNLEGSAIFSDEHTMCALTPLNDDFKDYPKKKNMDLHIVSAEELCEKKIIGINIQKDMEMEDLKDNFTMKVCENDRTFHISPKNITKAFGVRKLMDHLGLTNEDCSFIGNGNNDIEILELCNTSYAVGNANESVKRAAKTVLKEDYDKGAFQKAVNMIVASCE